MTSTHQAPDDLLRAVEASHEQYLRNLRSLHEALAGNVRQRNRSDSRASYTAPSPLLRPTSSPHLSPTIVYDATFARHPPSIAPSDLRERQGTGGIHLTKPHIPPSLHSEYEVEYLPLLDARPGHRVSRPGDLAGSDPSTGHVRHLRPIERVSWTDQQLLTHLKRAPFTGGAEVALKRILEKREEIDVDTDFRSFAAFENEEYVSSTLELYDVDADGTANPVGKQIDRRMPGAQQVLSPSQIVDASTVWNALKEVHTGENTVGLMTILQEPTPLMLSALHLTMSPYFDTTELLNHLITDTENKGKTKAHVARAFVKDPPTSPTRDQYLRKRSFFFVFKYYTVVGEGLEPAHWQQYDKRPSDKRSMDHIDIAECSSVLALSLSGPPAGSVRVSKRKEGWQEGYIFDTFAPWHLLSIQSFPDDEHTVRSDLSSPTGAANKRNFVNGPYAFLDALAAEYRDATKRNQALHERITKLITPPTDFMFDGRLRDKLLFEDKHFTYIRRYFWAYNSLGVINAGIRAMLASYRESFTDEFWEGKHSTLWPHPDPDGLEGRVYRDRMSLVRGELERACADLEGVIARNVATRKEIENLRDQLFSGSSIRESRRAIEQGDNIKVLTLSSMVFLPLTFVTSVFGITDFNIPPTDWRFALTMICVCVPFLLLLILLQTRAGWSLFKRISDMSRDYCTRVFKSAVTWISPASAAELKGGGPDPRYQGAAGLGSRVSTLTGEVKPRRKRRLTVRRAVPGEKMAEAEESWTSWGPWKWRRAKKGLGIEIATVEGMKDNAV